MYFLIVEHSILLFKFIISCQLKDESATVRKGIMWQKRVTSEKLYGKISDDSNRDIKGLYFSDVEGSDTIVYDPERIKKVNS